MKDPERIQSVQLWLLALIFFYVFEASAAEVDGKEIASCAAKKGALEKLECYESIARKYELDKPRGQQVDQPTKGKWRTSLEINPIDDSRTATATLRASTGGGALRNAPSLVVRCKSGQLDIYVNWDNYLGSEAYVTFRMGKAPAQRSFWSLSTDSKATFARKPLDYLRKMNGVNQVVAQVTPYNESPVTAIFDMEGYSEASETIRNTCGIKNFQSDAPKLGGSIKSAVKGESERIVAKKSAEILDGIRAGDYIEFFGVTLDLNFRIVRLDKSQQGRNITVGDKLLEIRATSVDGALISEYLVRDFTNDPPALSVTIERNGERKTRSIRIR